MTNKSINAALLAIQPLTVRANAADAERLRGLRAFSVVVETVPPNDCGVTTADVKVRLLATLSRSRIKIDGNPAGFDYATVNISDDCSAANVEIEVHQSVVILPSRFQTLANVWSTGQLLSGHDRMRENVLTSVAKHTRSLIADWSSVNRVK